MTDYGMMLRDHDPTGNIPAEISSKVSVVGR